MPRDAAPDADPDGRRHAPASRYPTARQAAGTPLATTQPQDTARRGATTRALMTRLAGPTDMAAHITTHSDGA